MRFIHCPYCGGKLENKEIGDEGLIPFCFNCDTPLWDMFTTSVIIAVVNDNNEIALLKQDYVSKSHYVFVAGIMKPGESAEEAATREVKEELGLDVDSLEYIKSCPYNKKEMLMLGFKANVIKHKLITSKEVDSAVWVDINHASELLRKDSIGWQMVKSLKNK